MSIILNRLLRAATKGGWQAARFGPSGKSLRVTKGKEEVIVHFGADGRMRAAFRNGVRQNGGGLRRIIELFEEGK